MARTRVFAAFSFLLLLLATTGTTIAGAQERAGRLTLEAIYSPDRDVRVDFDGSVPFGVAWADADHYVMPPGDNRAGWTRVNASSGAESPAGDVAAIEASLGSIAGVGAADARSLASQAAGAIARGAASTLLNHANDLFMVRADASSRRLTFDADPEVGEEISPDGRFVSFIRDYNMVLVDVESGRERTLTTDGSSELLYGRLDWVYQEEIYGRGNFKGYWWSPDSSAIAFLRMDESPVREFTVVDHIPTTLTTEVTNYPKAGYPNPTVTLGVIPAIGGATTWIDNAQYEPIQHLIVNVDWTPDSEHVVYQVQDREQTWLDVNLGDPASGASHTVLHEQTPAFVQVLGAPHWLPDGTFLWFSERTGFKHLYHYALDEDGGEARQLHAVTSGEWEARSLLGVSDAGRVYFSGTQHSPIAANVYSVGLDGSGLTRISRGEGSHSASFNPTFTHYVSTWSDVNTPPQMRLHAADGSDVRVIAANPTPKLAELELGTVEFLQVPARDGYPMEAMIIRPPDFDPSRKYPVLQYNYGGPHAPSVRNSWGGTTYLWHQMLAQQGYVIWICDNRSASGKGIAPTWEAYGQLGAVEMRDIEDGVSWLKQQPWVAADRIGIWGWSYGGFMASYALTHSTSFAAAIAGAPVTDWRLYDSIYTERYMKMPQNNPEGYDATSVVKAAANLHGKLFIIHGTIDDNVHMQNSVQLIYELQKAGKDFELMIYPRSRHGVRNPDQVFHLRREMTQFLLENL